MSVLACDRNNCTNIMCDILIENRYVCRECAAEFRSLIGNRELPLSEMASRFLRFMETPKSSCTSHESVSVDDFLESGRR